MKSVSSGFFLIEALIAVLVIAIGVTAALAGIGRALAMTSRAERFVLDVLPLETAVFNLETGGRPEDGAFPESVMAEGRDYLLAVEAIGTTDETSAPAKGLIPPFYRLRLEPAGDLSKHPASAEFVLGKELFS